MARGDAKRLNGLFIYHDEKGRTIYSNPFMKNGYIISDSEAKKYSFYAGRLWASVLLTLALLFIFDKKYFLAIGAGLLLYVISTLIFVFKYLDSLSLIKDFVKPKKDGFVKRKATTQSYARLVLTFIVSVAIAVLLIINAKQSEYSGIGLYGSYLLSAIMVATGLMNIVYIIYKKANKIVK